jgi:hypothetical protein
MCQEKWFNIFLDIRKQRALLLDLECPKRLSVLNQLSYVNESSKKNLNEKKPTRVQNKN